MAASGQDRIERRLAAVLAADVAGYSRLTGVDEEGTHAQLQAHLGVLVDPKIAEHRGRVVKNTGDGMLAEFGSVVDAVRCALDVQRGMAERNAGVPDDKRIEFRMGINVGDIIIDRGDIFGDGVNVAARLEGLAEPGGICVSGRVQEDARGKLDVAFEDAGEQQLKNIAWPVRVYRVRLRGEAPQSRPALALPDKPSIAALPFTNMSGDSEQDYFADGMTEDIITALSHIPTLFVIARNSSFAYKGRAIDIRQVGRELGVRYVLEGSVRKAGQRLRITGQLIEAETGTHLWADRFDSFLEDVFDLQDRVTMAVAGAMEPSITQAEIRRANRKPTANLRAYDWLLRAIGEQQLYSREAVDRAMQMARRAIELDPRYAQAYAYLASWTSRRMIYGWMEDEAGETAEGVRFAHLAVQLEPNDSIVLTEAAFGLGHLNRDLATAIPWLDRAVALNPNSAMALGRGAIVRNFAGNYITAAEHADRAMRLSPFDSYSFAFSLARGMSHLFRRQPPEAVAWLHKAAQQNPRHSSTFVFLSSALAHAGQMDQARAAMERLLELNPMSSMRWRRQHRFFPETDNEYMLDGARLAGLPE
ncbi:adenylate/guanylate cyclase domain-containing protein [Bradyrhizobium sp. AUGA SZCCT0042]|uniref:adenylate/guanylate cyclase domain-containing protein n=1 Tax=Bradyrhizobium sp. AUGA SZCCT0042 TaxID=2807651 RepID=UPI001BADCA85|nr:adenylate/guanylate cyclase domain-containing protein [Bradyrhizobium sp. AUGA SZCCT0042]MBR1300622.1 adenylate/guanylate cyclase domain-containing protein [Bradyrhizobium sp. AUGA SZCCT0042]